MESVYSNNHIYTKLLELVEKQQPCILSTITETLGSTPQKKGNSAIFDEKGLIGGTIGGGVVEHEIQKKAAEVIRTKKSCYLRFDLGNEIADEDAAICGGGMSVVLDATPEKHKSVFKELKNAYESRIPGVLISICNSGNKGEFDITRLWITGETFPNVSNKLRPDDCDTVSQMLANPVQGEFREIVIHTSPEYEDDYVFMESVVPLPRLIIAGAGHVGKALSHFGKKLDFEVIVWDDRKEYATSKNLPDADKILNGELTKSLGNFKVDRETYIAIVTHGHKNDADVLKMFINSEAGYIGMIGSKTKVAQVREKFLREGWTTAEKWEKIYSPVGLDIHSKTIQEIALSIAAQIVKVRRSK